ncbi:hypothetical protein EVAR_11700_1 [Eumeta japonica]|uniref:Uncharacterized protein n=1 Tax=Eumeta variegata TaxID=151549 RepID=A0A4C1U4I3_EUMVA|nr:hypothetical protein EVAR_11700_1 [Eumeta japonica]
MPLIDNFFGTTYLDPDTDDVIKLYLILAALVGADRLDLYDFKRNFKFCIRVFAVAFNAIIIYSSVRYPCETNRNKIILSCCLTEFYICVLKAHASLDHMRDF